MSRMCDWFATHTDVAGAGPIIMRRDITLLAFTRLAITVVTDMATVTAGMVIAVGNRIEEGLTALLFLFD